MAAMRTYNSGRSEGRLTQQKSTEIWQLHRWDNRPRGSFTHRFSFFILPEQHSSLWAWGCHSQKATTQSPTFPAAWAKRKRTGRLRKVRLVLRWDKAIIIILNGRQQEFSPTGMTRTLHALVWATSAVIPAPMLKRCCSSCVHAWLWQTVFV